MGYRAELVVRQRNDSVHYASLVAVVFGVGAFLAFLVAGWPAGATGIHVALLGLMFQVFVRRNALARRRARTVNVDATGVTVDGRLLPASTFTSGYFQPRFGSRRRDRPSVVLLDRARRITFEAEVPNEHAAEEVLRAVGLDAAKKSVEFRALSAALTTFWPRLAVGAFAAAIAVLARHGGAQASPGIFMLAFLPAAFALSLPSKVVVGVDGILVRWLWRRRFIPHADIVDVTREGPHALRIRRRSGLDELLWTTKKTSSVSGLEQQRRDAMLARIQAAHRAYLEAGPRADVSALLARGARSAREWRSALDALSGDRGYREASVRPEDLLGVLEDPRAPEDVRAAAAAVLVRKSDDATKARIRVVADATASPKLRVVLDAAARGAEDLLDRALEDVVEEPRARGVAAFE